MRLIKTLLIKAVKNQMCLNLLGGENEAVGVLHSEHRSPKSSCCDSGAGNAMCSFEHMHFLSSNRVRNSLHAQAQGENCTCLRLIQEAPC